MPRVITEKAPHSPATLARVELLIRTWLRADEASERAWDAACRSRKEALDALLMIGGEHSLDGWNYTVVRGTLVNNIERRPCRVGKWKRGTLGTPVGP